MVSIVGDRYLPLEQEILLFAYYNTLVNSSLLVRVAVELSYNTVSNDTIKFCRVKFLKGPTIALGLMFF